MNMDTCFWRGISCPYFHRSPWFGALVCARSTAHIKSHWHSSLKNRLRTVGNWCAWALSPPGTEPPPEASPAMPQGQTRSMPGAPLPGAALNTFRSAPQSAGKLVVPSSAALMGQAGPGLGTPQGYAQAQAPPGTPGFLTPSPGLAAPGFGTGDIPAAYQGQAGGAAWAPASAPPAAAPEISQEASNHMR